MPAGMHHAHIFAAPVCARRRSKQQALRLGDRQRIHVRTQCNHRARTSAANERRDNSGDGYLLADLIAKLPQVLCNQAGGADFSIAKLGILMNITPPSDHLALDHLRVRIEFRVDGACRRSDGVGRSKTSEFQIEQRRKPACANRAEQLAAINSIGCHSFGDKTPLLS